MSIHPIPEARHFEPVLRPDLGALYTRRAARLRHLADGHDLADYLRLAAAVAEAQAGLQEGLATAARPDPVLLARSGIWPGLLSRLIDRIRPETPTPALAHLDALKSLPEPALHASALALVAGRFDAVDPAQAPILWAALSVEVAVAARLGPLPPKADEETRECPVCGAAPVASLIHSGDNQGFRYLHCALCDCEWHMVRAKCTCCGDAGQLDYLSFDTPEATIRAEACNACGGYLKVVSAERDPEVEVVADDLASLPLDDAAVAEGFGRTGFNPFALPG